MRTFNPKIADVLIGLATKSKINVATRGKKCVGSIDGKTYHYSDGTKDEGQELTQCQAEYGDNIFAWLET